MMEALITSSRKEVPSHYILKIEAFSSVVSSIDKHESRVFEASGYKWKLLFYPKKTHDEIPNISLNLEISENDNTLSPAWEINAMVSFFFYNHRTDKYMTIQYRKLQRFHEINTVCEYLHPYETFTNPTNGYLKNDCCVFGVEVFVVKNQGRVETLSLKKEADILKTYTWKIDKFSELTDECCYSDAFSKAGCEWKLRLGPKGSAVWKGNCVSLFLQIHNPQNLSPGWGKYVKYKLRIRNQVSGNHKEKTAKAMFCAATLAWGFGNFVSLADLNRSTNGYLVGDTLVVEGEIITFSEVKDFPE